MFLIPRFGDGTNVVPLNTPHGNAVEGVRRQPCGLTLWQCLASAVDLRTKDLYCFPAVEHINVWSALSSMAVSLAISGTTGLPKRQGDTPNAVPVVLPAPAPAPLPVIVPAPPPAVTTSLAFNRERVPVAPPLQQAGPVFDLRAHTATVVALEIENFRAVPVQPDIRVNTLEWWKANRQSFPHLARVARIVLAVPATSAPSERMWSEAGLVVRAKRAKLDPENVALLVFNRALYHFEERYNVIF